MNNLAIIPARAGSKRIPGKNILDFFGRPLLSYSIRTALDSSLFELVHVSTESSEIAEVARSYGADVEFLRPADLADDTASLYDVLKWVVDEYERRGRSFDTVCLLTATAVLIRPEDLKGAFAAHVNSGGTRPTIGVSTFPAPIEQALVGVEDGTVRFWMPDQAMQRSQDFVPKYYDSGTFVIFNPASYFSQPLFENGLVPYVLPRWKGIDINDYEDLEVAKRIWTSLDAFQ